MVDDRSWVDTLKSTNWALEVIGRAREQFLLGFGIGIGIEEPGQFNRDWLMALRTRNTGFWHNISFLQFYSGVNYNIHPRQFSLLRITFY
jgi:hypothetical protein